MAESYVCPCLRARAFPSLTVKKKNRQEIDDFIFRQSKTAMGVGRIRAYCKATLVDTPNVLV
jgi:hypothetical protein